MTRPSPFSVRGRRALMVMRDERDISILRRQLDRLGMTVAEHDPDEAPPPNQSVDVVVLDADSIPIKSDPARAWKIQAPIIALIGPEHRAARVPESSRCARLDFTPRWWLRSIPPSEELMKPHISKNWRIVFGPGASSSPRFCKSCALTIFPKPTHLRWSGRRPCGIARQSSS